MNPEEQPAAGYHDDEIDLRDLALMLIEGWHWIVGTLVVVLVAAIVYLAVATPTYSTSLTFTKAADGLRTLNAVPDVSYTQDEVVGELSQRLASYENFSRFLDMSDIGRENFVNALKDVSDEATLADTQRRFFSQNLAVSQPDEEETLASLQLSYNERLAGPDFVNGYYRWSEEKYRRQLAERAERAVNLTVEKNRSQMEAHREAYQEEIDARIARMKEADSIELAKLRDRLEAEKQNTVSARQERIRVLRQAEQVAAQLGITRPTTPGDLGRQQGERNIVYAEINSQEGLPLYFMGTDALEAEREVLEANLREDAQTPEIRSIEKQISLLKDNREIEAIQNRQQDSPFIEEYNRLRQQNTLLQANLVSPDEIHVAEVTNWAYQPSGPDSPRKALVLALSLVLGGMLGVMLVFLARFASSLRGYKQAKQD